MEYLDFHVINISISIGCIVFLVQQTDFIYEYSSVILRVLRLNFLYKLLQFNVYENSSNFQNYIFFIGSIQGVKKNALGFVCRLISCFICLNCFISVFSVLLVTKNPIMIFPCFFLSVLTFHILFKIKKSIYS
jgi:hypothetical protein